MAGISLHPPTWKQNSMNRRLLRLLSILLMMDNSACALPPSGGNVFCSLEKSKTEKDLSHDEAHH